MGEAAKVFYDPPGGWRYGFPKPYLPVEDEPLEQTLVRDGYPAKEAEFGARHCRFIGDIPKPALAITAVLRNATRVPRGDDVRAPCLRGVVASDIKGRFLDGEPIITSTILEELPGDVFRTRNSVYRVESWAEPANDNQPFQRKTLADLVALPGVIYVASPYTNYPLGHHAAAYDAARATAALMRKGLRAVSPVAHSHAVATVGGLDLVDGDFWQRQDAPLVDAASACVVVMLDGWMTSQGVQHEIGVFRAAGKPVVFVEPEELWG